MLDSKEDIRVRFEKRHKQDMEELIANFKLKARVTN